MYQIEIKGLRLFGYHGVYENERSEGQVFEFDLICDLSKDQIEDSLDDTVDYVEVVEEINVVNGSQKFHLLEALCDAVIQHLFEKYATISRIEICVRKDLHFQGVDVDQISVIVTRTRTEIT